MMTIGLGNWFIVFHIIWQIKHYTHDYHDLTGVDNDEISDS
jgi:hypothetical protein